MGNAGRRELQCQWMVGLIWSRRTGWWLDKVCLADTFSLLDALMVSARSVIHAQVCLRGGQMDRRLGQFFSYRPGNPTVPPAGRPQQSFLIADQCTHTSVGPSPPVSTFTCLSSALSATTNLVKILITLLISGSSCYSVSEKNYPNTRQRDSTEELFYTRSRLRARIALFVAVSPLIR